MNPLFCRHPLCELQMSTWERKSSPWRLCLRYYVWAALFVSCHLEERSFCIKRNQQKNTNGEKSVDLITVEKFLKKVCKYVQADLPSVMLSNGTRGNGHRLKHKRLSLSARKHIVFTEGDQAVVQIGQRRHRSLSLEILKSHLDSVLDNWL